jgi:succinyl-CoA synthetase beta subunit
MLESDFASALRSLDELRAAGIRVSDEPTGKRLLATLGIAIPSGEVVYDPDEAAQVAQRIGLPVVVKAATCNLPHKSDMGGVEGPLHSIEAVRTGAAKVQRAVLEHPQLLDRPGLLVERWQDTAIAWFVGLSLKGPFGPVVACGLGGVWVELFEDIAFRLAPIGVDEAHEMVGQLRASRVLGGYRGQAPAHTLVLAKALAALSSLARHDHARQVISEVDINPLGISARGDAVALDCTVVLA